jgi:hypothetical protein
LKNIYPGVFLFDLFFGFYPLRGGGGGPEIFENICPHKGKGDEPREMHFPHSSYANNTERDFSGENKGLGRKLS